MAKKRTINELRQTKEYYTGNKPRQVLSDVAGEYYQNNSEPVILIVDKITKHFSDFLFEMVNKEMGEKYVFQSQNYFTDAGYEQFEDEWFEFYHEHHGDIIYEVMQNITN